MQFQSVRIILVETSHPGNIGAAARAMKTMGFDALYLVQPQKFPHPQALAMSAGAEDILAKAIVCQSLEEAIADCDFVIGSSARPRAVQLPGSMPAETAEQIAAKPDSAKVALVFGREHAGLNNEELLLCHRHSMIPANPEYSSLNLAQAVQIFCYELRLKMHSSDISVSNYEQTPARSEDIAGFYAHLDEVLKQIDFYRPHGEKKLKQKLRRLFNRTALEYEEVQLLRGILKQIQRCVRQDIFKDKEIE